MSLTGKRKTLLDPVTGEALVPNTTPEAAGTYAKAAILSAATKLLYGKGDDAIPDDIFADLKTITDNIAAAASSGAKIETGSYVGTGKMGSSTPNKITFNFKPILVVVVNTIANSSINFMVLVRNGKSGYPSPAGSYFNYLTCGDNFVSWYAAEGNAEYQMNRASTTYVYVAFG